jgi:hypothetical protein
MKMMMSKKELEKTKREIRCAFKGPFCTCWIWKRVDDEKLGDN